MEKDINTKLVDIYMKLLREDNKMRHESDAERQRRLQDLAEMTSPKNVKNYLKSWEIVHEFIDNMRKQARKK